MKAFELYEPATLAEATQTLTQLGPRARVLGGGSDLVGGIMKDWVTGKGMPLPDQIIDLTTIPDLKGIKFAKGYDFVNDTEHANDDQAELAEFVTH